MTKIIVGLGNPGNDYKYTKHNVGFMVVDQLAKKENVTFNHTKYNALVAEFNYQGEKVILVKPQTYMNLSGQAVKPLLAYFKVALHDLVVVYDDLDLPIGKIRLRQQGSAGGHNGVKNIIQLLDSQTFNRIKIGIGRPRVFETVVQHVLSPFLKEDEQSIQKGIDDSVRALSFFIANKQTDAFLHTMNQFN